MGTTSFRTADFNQKIERQLTLLSKFWEVHTDVVWSGNDEIQSLYYDFMKDNDFLTGDAFKLVFTIGFVIDDARSGNLVVVNLDFT